MIKGVLRLKKDTNYYSIISWDQKEIKGFTRGSGVKNLPANAGDMGSIPGLGKPCMSERN